MEKEQVIQKVKELIADLEKKAKRKAWSDNEDFNAPNYSGGNFDDAYAGGERDGATGLAREILPVLMLLRNELES